MKILTLSLGVKIQNVLNYFSTKFPDDQCIFLCEFFFSKIDSGNEVGIGYRSNQVTMEQVHRERRL